jgi:hypothetical protein
MTIQPNFHVSATAGVEETVAVTVIGSREKLRAEAPEFERLLPPQPTTHSLTQSESNLGEDAPVFREPLTQSRPTRWWGIND